MSKQFDALLDFWAKNNMNVLLEGEHGFGKTAVVGSTFERNGMRWKYFSASTMDPWVDLVGVPKEYTDDNGDTYLRLIRPKEFQNDEYDAIFFDEFNRAPKKVRNAVMELIQFKSINGHKFKNLKVVWAAINPHDDEETYDVEKLDPAQIDRFHVRYKVPSVPDKDFFISTYGADMGKAAIEWWNAMPEKAQKHVSARRLQYVLDCYRAGGDIKYIVHDSTNPSKLLLALNSGSLVDKLRQVLSSGDKSALQTFLRKDNHFDVAVTMMRHEPKTIEVIVPCIDEERLMRLVHDIAGVREFVLRDDNVDDYADMLRETLNSGTLDKKEEGRIRSILSKGVVDTATDLPMYEHRSEIATATHELVYKNIKNWATTLANADEQVVLAAYDFMAMNLTEPKTPTEAVNALRVIYRFIERTKDDILSTRYTKIVPMVNFVLAYLQKKKVSVNSPTVRRIFSEGELRLNSKTKVQRFLDTHHEKLIVKPRLF